MRGNYSCRFSVFSALGVFQTPNRYFLDCPVKKKTSQVRDVFKSSNSGGKAEIFSGRKTAYWGRQPPLRRACCSMPKAIAIAPKIAAYSAGSGTTVRA